MKTENWAIALIEICTALIVALSLAIFITKL